MDSAISTLKFVGKSLYYMLEALFFCIVPKRRKSVAGEIVLITGAGSGIGRLLALKFARLGAILVLWDVNEEGNKETAKLAQETGAARVHAYTCDCSRKEEVYSVASQVKREVGDVTILVNNAGVVTGKRFLDSPDEMVERSFQVNSIAHFWTYKAFLPAMVASNHGHLVSISSAAGLIGVSGLADYCASKFAAYGFAEAISLEMFAQGVTGVKSTLVCPYFTNTGMFDGCSTRSPHLLPILEPEYVASKIVDAILQEQVYLYIPRSLYFLMVLKSMFPSKLGLALGEFLGVFNSMDHFRGREKKD
ncbi:epidermal retinol dehydrogenase 2 [Tachyglossus aculeatus]|uniref:epidermal retinol dehydrogenase 2 n=1 Tax=Tachyglossus aculeatus TaxID=9261 RepID=UPI0018F45A6A|nr:epidermal retinol dehydrogenase 2 [Tachyglossus aculeatus]